MYIFFSKIWNKLHFRRVEAARKLRQPSVAIWENNLRDDLADLRSMVARDYSAILIGVDDASKFHHMKGENNLSLSDKDRRRFEFLFKMAIRVVWIALKKRHLALIGNFVCLNNPNCISFYSFLFLSIHFLITQSQRVL